MARPASISKAYTVGALFIVVGVVWGMATGAEGIEPIPMGLAVAGGLGVIAAAFTSIRTKRRQAAAPAAEE